MARYVVIPGPGFSGTFTPGTMPIDPEFTRLVNRTRVGLSSDSVHKG